MNKKRIRFTRTLAAAMILLLLSAFLAVPAGAENQNGLVVEKLAFRDVLRLYTADRASFGENALATDENGVTNAAKRLAEMFTFTVGLNYTGEGPNYNYFGKDITGKMGTEPYVDANLLATYSVEILPYRSYALALPEGQSCGIRVYLTGYTNAANGVEPVLHYVWQDGGVWYAVKDDNPYYRVSYNGQNARQTGARSLVQSRASGNGTAVLETWTSLSDAPDGSGVVHLAGSTLVAGQGSANVFGVTADLKALSETGGLSPSLTAVSDFVRGDTTYQTGPLVYSRECYEEGTMHRVPDGEALQEGVTYRFRVVYDEALCVAPNADWADAGLSICSEVTGEKTAVTDFTWYGDAAYLTNDRYNPHTVEFTFTPTRQGNGVCTFTLENLVGSESALKAADFHTCTATSVTAAPAAVETPAETAAPTAEPTVEPTTEPAAEPTVEPAAEATAEPTVEPTTEPTVEPTAEPATPAPAATPSATTQATTLPLLAAGGENGVVTRGMLAESLWTLSGRPAAAGSAAFADLPADSARSEAILWAAGIGLINGVSESCFGTDQPVTREQVAVVLQRFASIQGADIGVAGDLSGWNDGGEVSAWAQEAVIWALRTGTLSPREDGSVAPRENALCGDVTGMIFRLQQMV